MVQMGLMSAPWTSESEDSLDMQRNAQGKIIFRGPRVSILVHSCNTITCSQWVVPEQPEGVWPLTPNAVNRANNDAAAVIEIV